MTVNELIEKLKEFPPDEEVFILDEHDIHLSIDGVECDGMHVISIF